MTSIRNNEDRYLDAARECILDVGWRRTTLTEVARRGLNVSEAAEADRRPNILWITCEDISPNLGCYGDDYAVTPNLDRLAREGMMLRNVFVTNSICTPSRAAVASRNAIISRNFQVVSTCRSGNGGFAG